MAIAGRVTNVYDHKYGSELDGDHAAGATSLTVVWTNDFNADGGQLYLEDAGGGNQSATIAYTVPVDPETELPSGTVINLATPLAAPYLSGDSVWVSPVKVDRWAWFMEPDAEEPSKARVPHQLKPLLTLGQRNADTAEQIEAEPSGTQLVVSDVLAKPAQGDLSSIDWSTSPDGTGQRVDIDSAGVRLIDAADDVLANLPTDETQTPTFAGYVAAAGLDLEVGATDLNKVRWTRVSDGALGGHVYVGPGSGGDPIGELTAFNQDDPTRFAKLEFGTTPGGGFYLSVDDGAGVSRTVKLLGMDGASDFGDEWAAWTPAFTGWSANPTGGAYRYKQTGKTVTCMINQPNTGTSNATTKTISLPVTAATVSGANWNGPCTIVDNGVTATTSGRASVTSAATTASIFTNWSGGAWTASGAARVANLMLVYEAA